MAKSKNSSAEQPNKTLAALSKHITTFTFVSVAMEICKYNQNPILVHLHILGKTPRRRESVYEKAKEAFGTRGNGNRNRSVVDVGVKAAEFAKRRWVVRESPFTD